MKHHNNSTLADTGDLDGIRSEALRKVGRNIVNFAKIEAGLKILLASTNIAGSPRELLKVHQQRIRVNRKKTLGEISMLFNGVLTKGEENCESHPEELEGIHIAISLRVEDDKGSSQQFRKSLRELVKDRNILIHHRLAELDSTSIMSYLSLVEYLDEQHIRIITKLEMIGSLIDLLQELHKESASILEWHQSQCLAGEGDLER